MFVVSALIVRPSLQRFSFLGLNHPLLLSLLTPNCLIPRFILSFVLIIVGSLNRITLTTVLALVGSFLDLFCLAETAVVGITVLSDILALCINATDWLKVSMLLTFYVYYCRL